MQILKFQLDRPNNSYGLMWIEVPDSTSLLSVIEKDGVIWLYGACSNQYSVEDKKKLKVYIAGTGKEISLFEIQDLTFMGTVKQSVFVWHVYAQLN